MTTSTPKQCHIKSPLVYSPKLSKQSGQNVYLKLDNLQPSGSFKIRGVGRSVQVAYAEHGPNVQIISSSGGNAGLAAATAARMLNLKCTVYCPESASDDVVALLQSENATVVRKGKAWDEANALAEATVDQINNDNSNGSKAVLIHPFIGKPIVEGASTLIDEIYSQLQEEFGFEQNQGPDYISAVVGGGGLMNGILTGLLNRQQQNQSAKLPVVLGVQCFGANSFSQSRSNGKLTTLPAITSKATSMGALTCSQDTLETTSKYTSSNPDNFHCIDVTDEIASSGSWKLARDHRLLVELSCGAALAPVYFSNRFDEKVFNNEKGKNIVIIVCGGSKDTLQDVYQYEVQEAKHSKGYAEDKIALDGHLI
ncbi:unnamed protein product [Sympodiomycopsis kandeliae]